MRNAEGQPHIAIITYHNLHDHGRPVPRCPLRLLSNAGVRYDVACMDAFAESVRPGSTYAGILNEGQVAELRRDVPQGGLDILDTKLHWLLPSGCYVA